MRPTVSHIIFSNHLQTHMEALEDESIPFDPAQNIFYQTQNAIYMFTAVLL